MFRTRRSRSILAACLLGIAFLLHLLSGKSTAQANAQLQRVARPSNRPQFDPSWDRARNVSLDQAATGFTIGGAVVGLSALLRDGDSIRSKLPRDLLDVALFMLSPQDPYRVRDLLNGGVVILGRPGSGKTSSSGKTLMRALAAKSGMLIIASKPEEKAEVIALFTELGRVHDLIIVEPGSAWRFDFFGYMAAKGADTAAIADCIVTIGESLEAGQGHGGGDDRFFRQQNRLWIFNAVIIVRIALGRVSANELHRFINTAAQTPAHLHDENWQKNSFHNRCIGTAYEKVKGVSTNEADDCRLAIEGWLREWPHMADKTRTSILAGINGILHTGSTGLVREMSTGESNCSPDVMFEGKSILLNVPISKYGPGGAYIGAGWRFLTQQAVLRREAKPGDCVNVIWIDEFQTTINSHDYQFLAQCRSHLGCMVCLTQSIPGLIAALKGHTGRAQAEALLATFGTKIYHACDPQTAEYASSSIGKTLTTFCGGSMAPEQDIWDAIGLGASQFTGSFSEHMESIVQPSAFMNGLRTGSKVNEFLCDAIVVRSGEPFASTGQNFIQVAFSQR